MLALFSRHHLGAAVITHLGSVADAVAQFVARDRAVEEERERLARELHDSVSQAIYGLVLGTRSTADAPARGDPATAIAALEEVAAMAETAHSEMRELLVELHGSAAADEGLGAAVRRAAAAMAARHRGVEVRCRVADLEPELPAPTGQALYRIAQEALRNALRHAGPRRVDVRLEDGPDSVTLEVCDDGTGFDPAARAPAGWAGLDARARGADRRAPAGAQRPWERHHHRRDRPPVPAGLTPVSAPRC